MKRFLLVFTVSLVAVAATAQKKKPATKAKPGAATETKATAPGLKTSVDSFSYAFGLNIANYLKAQNVDQVNYAAMQQAIEDVLKDKKTAMDVQQANACMQTTFEASVGKKSKAEKEKSAKFLAENKKRTGVVSLPNGLQYEVIKSGEPNGAVPELQDTVVAHYAGTLVDGKEFDNSYKRGQPLTIPVAGVIRGWTEILQKMHVGDKWKVYIPSELGYGDRGAGADIPGGAALVFEMELLEVKKAGHQQQQPEVAAPVEEKKN